MRLFLCMFCPVLALTACGETDDNPPPDSNDSGTNTTNTGCSNLGFTPGYGDLAFNELTANAPLPMTHGPQGGWHIDTSGLVTGTEGELRLTLSVTLEDGTVLTTEQVPEIKALSSTGECEGEFYGVRAYLTYFPNPNAKQAFICSLQDQAAEICWDIEDIVSQEMLHQCQDAIIKTDPGDDEKCN